MVSVVTLSRPVTFSFPSKFWNTTFRYAGAVQRFHTLLIELFVLPDHLLDVPVLRHIRRDLFQCYPQNIYPRCQHHVEYGTQLCELVGGAVGALSLTLIVRNRFPPR